MSLPLRLKSQAISSSIDMIIPAAFFLSNSFRSSSIFSWNFLPEYFSGKALTFSVGLEGLSEPQTLSTRFSLTPTREAPLFFFRDSCNLRASGAVITVGSTPMVLPPSACSAVLRLSSVLALDFQTNPTYHSCHVGTSSIPCFKRVQLVSSCFEA